MLINIYDKVQIDLKNCPKRYEAFFSEQLDCFCTDNDLKVDVQTVSVQCVENLPTADNVKHFGDMSYDDTYLYFHASKGGALMGMSLMPGSAELLFQSGTKPLDVFTIADMLIKNLIVEQGACFMHASGAMLDGMSYVFPAWGGSGKSNLLIELMQNGAKYLGDDTIIFDETGKVYPFPRPLNLLSYNFRANQALLLPSASQKTRTSFSRLELLQKLVPKCFVSKGLPSKIYNKILARLSAGAHEYISVERIFKGAKLEELGPKSKFQIFFLERSSKKGVQSKDIEPECFSNKMASCLRWERNYFSDLFLAYTFAFPEKAALIQETYKKEVAISAQCSRLASKMKSVLVGQDSTSRELYEHVIKND